MGSNPKYFHSLGVGYLAWSVSPLDYCTSFICFLEKGFIGATIRKILITWRILDISVNAYYIIMYIYKCQIFWKLSRITCFLQGFHIAMLEIAQRPNLQMRPKCTFFRCVSISISANFTRIQIDRQTDRHLALFDCVWLCMVLYGFAWLCMTMYDYVWLCMTMYDNVWLCMTMYDYVWLCMIIHD